MNNFIKDIKSNFRCDYKIYVMIILISFFVSFITINIFNSPSDEESLVIYSNYNFSEDSKLEIKDMFSNIESLEVYYDDFIDNTRFGTTGIMLSDLFILNKDSLDYISSELSSIMLMIDNSYYIKIPENSRFYSLYDIKDEVYILINKNSSNISIEHNEVYILIEYWLEEEV